MGFWDAFSGKMGRWRAITTEATTTANSNLAKHISYLRGYP